MLRRDFTAKALSLTALPYSAMAQSPKPTGGARPQRFGDGRDWFFAKRYGMFVHWGLYAIPAWHEQHPWRARVARAEYVKYSAQWNPTKFDPNQWLNLMEDAGMQYVCLTTKHHDGFCMWNTKLTKFNTVNTPYQRDIVEQLANVCHKRSVPLCLYYSIADWNHPNYPNQGRHHELAKPEPGDQPDWNRYLDFLRGQVQELCTQYGELHGFWWDMNVPLHKEPGINAQIRKWQPKAVINNRGFDEGDFGTPERDYDTAAADAMGFARPTEACQSVGMESWGYRRDESYYTDRHLIRSIDRYLARDANYLLNVGPNAEGVIPQPAEGIVRRIGAWYKSVRESYENVVPASQLTPNRNILLTRRDRTLYVHLNRDLQGDGVKLKPINVAPVKATLLNTGAPVSTIVDLVPSEHMEQKKYLRLRGLPANDTANTVLVVKLEFDRPVEEWASSAAGTHKLSENQK